MTLPEAHRLLFINCDDLCFNKCLPVVNQIYYHFEQQIKELEALQAHKTCDECKWKSNPNLHHAYCGNCSRAIHLKDNYKPKDK